MQYNLIIKIYYGKIIVYEGHYVDREKPGRYLHSYLYINASLNKFAYLYNNLKLNATESKNVYWDCGYQLSQMYILREIILNNFLVIYGMAVLITDN